MDNPVCSSGLTRESWPLGKRSVLPMARSGKALIKDVEITKQLEYNDDAMEIKGLERNRKLAILDAKKESAIEYVSSNDDEDTLKSSIPLEKDENSASLDFNYHEFQSSQDPDFSLLYPELYHDTLMTFCVDESKDQ